MGIKEMNEALQRRREEQQASFSGGNELRLREGDVAFVKFVATGDEGDDYLSVYRAHAINGINADGKRFTNNFYCPQESKSDTTLECPLCQRNETSFKDRMSMWFWVSTILHATKKQDQNWDLIEYQGRSYYKEEIQDFKVWHTSAWSKSPWDTIMFLYNNYKAKLHGFTATLAATGAGLQRVYSIYALPETEGLTADEYATAKEKCQKLPEMLKKQAASSVSFKPAPAEEKEEVKPWHPSEIPSGTAKLPLKDLL